MRKQMTRLETGLEAELDALRTLHEEGNIDRRLYERMLYELISAGNNQKLHFFRKSTHKFIAITKNI